MQSNYVAMLPSSFLQDEQQQAEQQAEAISEKFFDEMRQLLEQKISSEAAAAADLETTTTTESPPILNAEERYIETTLSSAVDHIIKDNLPTIKPPKPTQVPLNRATIHSLVSNCEYFIFFLLSLSLLFRFDRWLIGRNWICA